MGIGGLTLADLLQVEAAAGIGSSQKAIINVHLDGGPPQMDLIDPKPDAPSEYRGTFAPIRTKIPGLHVTELMPKVASIADKFVFLRSLVGAAGAHDAFQCMSGFDARNQSASGGRPAMGCVLNQMLGSPDDVAPVFVDLMQGRPLVRNSARPGFLGPAYKPFRPDISHLFKRVLEDGMKIELNKLGAGHQVNLALNDGIDVGRLDDRLSLLQGLDSLRRHVDAEGSMDAMDRFHQQAYGILTSGKLADAIDLEKEDPKVLAHYTPEMQAEKLASYTSDGPLAARKLLLARRLVEAGVRCVSVSISDFDTHARNFSRLAQIGPIADHALWALVTDLENRGLLDDVTVVAWGEFGRTPKVNSEAGRDHWPRVAMGLMAGGGMNVGQVIGSTDRYAGEATSRPVHYQDVVATLYHNMGIDARAVTVPDAAGRPQYLVEHGEVIGELV